MLAKTLIVGLGGIGSKITANLAAKIPDDKKDKINFVVLDTDINDLGRIQREYQGLLRPIQTSTNSTVGAYLAKDTFTRDNSFPLNSNLYNKTLTEGAGQVRAISHLAFITAMMQKEFRKLDDAIMDLYKLEPEPYSQALRVIIVSSLAGGTGSGIILPVSMYIKQLIKTKMNLPGNIVRGFFILPEVIFDSVKAEDSRNNFRANAYAVLRELNAFILKADGNLPERYKDKVCLWFPKNDTNEFEEYNVLPMDFCFMFDAQNIDGKRLNSTEQYYEHAATCIYAQAIGPMNTRSNSSEDNTIRNLVSGKSRNRYAGAGASELWYPKKHILNYIALKWAAQTVSEHWTMFDRTYEDRKKDNNKKRLQGLNVPDLKPADSYIAAVNAAEKNGISFAKFVKNSTYYFDSLGITPRGNKWDDYLAAIREYVEELAKSNQNDVDEVGLTARKAIDKSRGKNVTASVFQSAYEHTKRYKEIISQRIDSMGRDAAHELFNKDENFTGDMRTQIEKYLIDNDNNFMHPNSVRFFLYQVLLKLKEEFNEVKNDNKSRDEGFEQSFGAKSSKDIGELVVNAKNPGFIAKITKKYNKEFHVRASRLNKVLATIDEYRVSAPYEIVLEAAIQHISKLCDAFEKFYKTFDSNVTEITRQINITEEKYELRKGSTTRYVCASKKCLDKFYEKMEFTGSSIGLSSNLCRRIYDEVKKFTLPHGGKPETFFKDIFDKEILEHFRETILSEYGQDIKMDIIRALELEAEYEGGIKEQHLITEYVKKVIEDTKSLAKPFINRPVGEDRVPIEACAYNKSLYLTDNPERENLVRTTLKSFGGVESNDDEIDVERVLFYTAIYGLYPFDLQKFAPPDKSKTMDQAAGEYYKTYHDMINNIDPDTQKSKVITPHLHKHWHIISEMPELNSTIQQDQEKTIYKALLLGLLYGRIVCVELKNNEADSKNKKYKYSFWRRDSSTEIHLLDLNGNSCNKFYKIADALTYNPMIVKMILNAVEHELNLEQTKNVDYEKSLLRKGIDLLELPEFTGDDRIISIFGIASAVKATTPPEKFIKEQGTLLLEVILETLYEQMGILCHKNECDRKFVELINNQFNLFQSNFGLFREKYPAVLDDYLSSLIQVVIVVMDRLGLTETADKFTDIKKNLREIIITGKNGANEGNDNSNNAQKK